MGKRNIRKPHKKRNKECITCFDCEECLYICEGDYICSVNCDIILEDFSMPTENYMWCNGKHFIREES